MIENHYSPNKHVDLAALALYDQELKKISMRMLLINVRVNFSLSDGKIIGLKNIIHDKGRQRTDLDLGLNIFGRFRQKRFRLREEHHQ